VHARRLYASCAYEYHATPLSLVPGSTHAQPVDFSRTRSYSQPRFAGRKAVTLSKLCRNAKRRKKTSIRKLRTPPNISRNALWVIPNNITRPSRTPPNGKRIASQTGSRARQPELPREDTARMSYTSVGP